MANTKKPEGIDFIVQYDADEDCEPPRITCSCGATNIVAKEQAFLSSACGASLPYLTGRTGGPAVAGKRKK